MPIKCCHGCVPPTRYPGCSDKCPRYKEEIEQYRQDKERMKAYLNSGLQVKKEK